MQTHDFRECMSIPNAQQPKEYKPKQITTKKQKQKQKQKIMEQKHAGHRTDCNYEQKAKIIEQTIMDHGAENHEDCNPRRKEQKQKKTIMARPRGGEAKDACISSGGAAF